MTVQQQSHFVSKRHQRKGAHVYPFAGEVAFSTVNNRWLSTFIGVSLIEFYEVVENGEPFCRGLCGDAAIVGYRCDIQNETDTPDNNFEEGCEECCILDIQKLMDVTFHISGGVVFEKFRDFPIVDKISWISSAKNRGQSISTFGYFRRFMNIERKKCK